LGAESATVASSSTQRSGSAPDARAYFLLLRQKKVAKEKATPLSPPRLRRGALRCGIAPGGCGTRPCGAQTVLAETPGAMALLGVAKGGKSRQQCHLWRSIRPALWVPLRRAEQRRLAGGRRRALSEGRSPELRSRALSDTKHREEVLLGCPASRVAQGTPAQQGRETGGRLLFGDFFLATQEKVTRRQGGTQRLRFLATLGMTAHPPSGRNPAQPRRNRLRRNQCSK